MIPVPRTQHLTSGSLALVMHGLFLAALVFGVSWKTLPHPVTVEADLWTDLPAPPPPPLPPAVEPEPVVKAPAPPSEADIALEKARKFKAELAARQRLEDKRLAAEQAKVDKERILKEQVERARLERERLEKARLFKEQQEKERIEKEKKEAVRRQLEQELAREMREQMEAESGQLKAVHDRTRSTQQARLVKDFRERIMLKIRGNVRLPPNLSGNPQVEFLVNLMPNGEVLRVSLIKSSGQRLYDQEVERAILKSSPLPLPPDKEAAAGFREAMKLTFRPHE